MPAPIDPPPPLAVLASFSGSGGVEHMLANLLCGFADLGRSVDLLLVRAEGPHLARLPEGVRPLRLGFGHHLPAIPGLVRYLRRQRPAALLAVKDRAGRAALLARALAGTDTRVVLRLGTHLSAALAGHSALARHWRYWPIRRLYPRLDGLVAVSRGVAEDIAAIAGLPATAITVIRNPVVTPALPRLAAEPCAHPWFRDRQLPVILGVGRFQRQKDFPTLVRAFARLREQRPSRLVLLGDGRGRGALEALIADLGLGSWVDLPGFQDNPFPFLAAADLFVLSSAWEGSPNALTQAMALGTPVVATDCPSGPAELLAGGRFGPLVAIGDVEGLARAMAATLAHPPPPQVLQQAVAEYNQPESARRYLRVLEATP